MIFSRVGLIKLISMPKFKISKKNKGFAFIEFQQEIDVNKSINLFNNCVPQEFLNNTSINK